jgi:hypothetical protein
MTRTNTVTPCLYWKENKNMSIKESKVAKGANISKPSNSKAKSAIVAI